MIIEVNGIQLFYRKTGMGTPLILLHGNGEDHHIFDQLTAKLQRDFTVYAIDSRNHGESMKTTDYAYETMSEDVFAFIRATGLEKANILGFSDGAIISLLLALRHGESIGKMALLGVNLKPEDFTEKSYRYLVNAYEKTKDPLIKLMLEEPNIDLSDIRVLQNPCLVIAAEKEIFKPETFVKLTENLPHAELKIMNGHTHESYIVNQDILYPDLIQFFK